MRYSNGFTIGWNNGETTPVAEPNQQGRKYSRPEERSECQNGLTRT